MSSCSGKEFRRCRNRHFSVLKRGWSAWKRTPHPPPDCHHRVLSSFGARNVSWLGMPLTVAPAAIYYTFGFEKQCVRPFVVFLASKLLMRGSQGKALTRP